MQRLEILSLGKETLKIAESLLTQIFPYEETTTKWLRASLDKVNNREFMEQHNVLDVDYYVALEYVSQKIIGVTGLYINKDGDKDNTLWIGWMGIISEFRGRGLGKLLLEKTINIAKNKGKRFIRVYTSNFHGEVIAMKMYENRGFKIFKTEPVKEADGTKYDMFYFELRL